MSYAPSDPLPQDISNPYQGLADPFQHLTQEQIAEQQQAVAAQNAAIQKGPGTVQPGLTTQAQPNAANRWPYLSAGPTDPPRGWTCQQGAMPAPAPYTPTGRVPDYSWEGPRRFDETTAPVAGIPQHTGNQAPLGGAVLDGYSNAFEDDRQRTGGVESDPAGPPG